MHDADMAAEVELQTPTQDTQRLIAAVLVCRFRVPCRLEDQKEVIFQQKHRVSRLVEQALRSG